MVDFWNSLDLNSASRFPFLNCLRFMTCKFRRCRSHSASHNNQGSDEFRKTCFRNTDYCVLIFAGCMAGARTHIHRQSEGPRMATKTNSGNMYQSNSGPCGLTTQRFLETFRYTGRSPREAIEQTGESTCLLFPAGFPHASEFLLFFV